MQGSLGFHQTNLGEELRDKSGHPANEIDGGPVLAHLGHWYT